MVSNVATLDRRIEASNSPIIEKNEYRLTIDKPGLAGRHPLACYHFALDDFAALSDMAKNEVDLGFTVTIELVASTENCYDYDDRTAGGQAGTTKGH